MSKDIPIAHAQAIPAPETKLVEVVAPATLVAGYSFLASVNGETVSITVPEGGVKEGQTFRTNVYSKTPSSAMAAAAGEATPLTGGDNTTYSSSTTPLADPNAPRGVWRDGLCDCCNLGPCHASLWNAICCPQILMAQVLTRMNMSWLAVRTNSTVSRNTFRNVIILLIVYWIASTVLAPPQPQVIVTGEDEVTVLPADYSSLKALLYQLVTWGFALYTLIVMMKLRGAIRERYSIPGNSCEDCCCVMFCGCCTVSQLARHTADYNERRAVCCTTTGLPPTQELYTAMVV